MLRALVLVFAWPPKTWEPALRAEAARSPPKRAWIDLSRSRVLYLCMMTGWVEGNVDGNGPRVLYYLCMITWGVQGNVDGNGSWTLEETFGNNVDDLLVGWGGVGGVVGGGLRPREVARQRRDATQLQCSGREHQNVLKNWSRSRRSQVRKLLCRGGLPGCATGSWVEPRRWTDV
jgi:hypothetical protein